jgi:hypothetical protein
MIEMFDRNAYQTKPMRPDRDYRTKPMRPIQKPMRKGNKRGS